MDMPAARLARWSLAAVCGSAVCLATAIGTDPVRAQTAGLTIVTREIYPEVVRETTERLAPGRKLEESRIVDSRAHAGEQLGTTSTITRCDREEFVILDRQQRTYFSRPLRWRPSALQMLLASFAYRRSARETTATAPSILIETTTVDTGERKTVFGRTARRVVTTTKRVPLQSDSGGSDETTMDGWYIDLETWTSCESTRGERGRSYLTVGSKSSTGRISVPRIVFKDVGTPEEGYPIELTTTSHGRIHAPNGFETSYTHKIHKVVTHFSSEPVDLGLFEIPKGFRPAEGPFARLAAHVNRTWYLLKGAAASVF